MGASVAHAKGKGSGPDEGWAVQWTGPLQAPHAEATRYKISFKEALMEANPLFRSTLCTAGVSLLSLLAVVSCATEVNGDLEADVIEIDEFVENEADPSVAELASTDVSEDAVELELPDGAELQGVSKSSSTDVRVMSLNIRIDKTDSNLERLSSRIPRIRKIVDEYSPDILGIQEGEKKTWSDFEDGVGSAYG